MDNALTALLIGTTTYSIALLGAPHVEGLVTIGGAEPPPIAIEIDIKHLTKRDIRGYVEKYARKGDIPSIMQTLTCEAPNNGDGTYDATGRSQLYNAQGEREDSWGLAQIHLPAHPQISKAEAQDPDFATKFISEQFAAGNAFLWTCWRNALSTD